ncbi:MAG TPA: M23 family metallopeptidase [Candidatus Binatia bacterium]|jgi:hypothetical protein|nr:M23 family metallopeptidase [Candidatus Binatia bacterium]
MRATAVALALLVLVPVAARGASTALLVTATNAPLRVLGSDGREHLEYDLVLTNAFSTPVTLTAIEVLAPDGHTLLRLDEEDLTVRTGPLLGGTPTREVAASGVLATTIDLAIPPGSAPPRVGHRITYTLPDTLLAAIIGSREILGPELTVDPRAPIAIASPIRGDGWMNANGCCDPAAPHRLMRLVVDGTRWTKMETFAIDWVRLRDGRLFTGDGASPTQWFGYDAEVLAVADGTVVSVRNDMPDQTPNQAVAGMHAPTDFTGNHVVLQLAPQVWATYAHLRPGSVDVREGDRITRGQRLGRLGNTGNSSAPHLHFQLSDGPDVVTSNSLPFVLTSYTRAGTVDPAQLDDASGDPLAPVLVVTGPPKPQAGTLPLAYTVIDVH